MYVAQKLDIVSAYGRDRGNANMTNRWTDKNNTTIHEFGYFIDGNFGRAFYSERISYFSQNYREINSFT